MKRPPKRKDNHKKASRLIIPFVSDSLDRKIYKRSLPNTIYMSVGLTSLLKV